MAKPQWIPETEAAKKVSRTPRTLRRLVKSGKWQVAIAAPNGRRYHYNEKDLEKILLQASTY